MGNAETVVIPVKLGLTGLDVRLCRVPGPDLGWSEDEWSPVGGAGSDEFSIPWFLASGKTVRVTVLGGSVFGSRP